MKKNKKIPVSQRVLEKISRSHINADQKKELEDIIVSPISYIPDERFSRPTVMNPIMQHLVVVQTGHTIRPEDEQILFLQMNYIRYKMCQVRRRLLRQGQWQEKDVLELLSRYQQQLDCRSKIVTGNMGLVMSMIQRAKYMSVEFTDLVSEGSMALLRATEKFDCARGFKFSTYACRAILKSFSRAAKQNYRYHRLFPFQLDNYLERSNKIEQSQSYDQEELVLEMRKMVIDNVAELSDIELSVVRLRYSLNKDQDSPLTLKEVGLRLGLTKERIRQIQNAALQKLRIVAEEHLVPA